MRYNCRFLFIVPVLEGNCLYHIISMLNHTIYSFSFSPSKSFCRLVIILYMYLYCEGRKLDNSLD